MHKYNNQDHSMLTAMMALSNMRGASHDVWAVNTDFDYHEEQKLAPAAHDDSAEAVDELSERAKVAARIG
jgi:hypothetical protein